MSALAQLPLLLLSVRTHHKFRKILSFFHQKVRTSTSEDPPLDRTDKLPHPECVRLLWTASYRTVFKNQVIDLSFQDQKLKRFRYID